MTTTVHIDVDVLRRAIKDEYAQVASCPSGEFHFHTGRPLAERLGYPGEDIEAIPIGSVESFAGVGNPFVFGPARPGDTVLDVGSGSGFDSLIAARQVGSGGRVIGVDMTDAMLEKARLGAQEAGLENVEFRPGLAEALPVADASVDVAVSNGVINLCPDKEAAYREVFRVLKAGGRLQIADIAVEQAVPQEAKLSIDLWTG